MFTVRPARLRVRLHGIRPSARVAFLVFVVLLRAGSGWAGELPAELAPGIAVVPQGQQAPPHTTLGVVYAHRWSRVGSDPPEWTSLYELAAQRARKLGADVVVRAISGEADPLIQNGHVRWFLGIAARSDVEADVAREPCDNCVVEWGPADIRTGVAPNAEMQTRLERMAFAITRLRLGEMGYYLSDSASVVDTVTALNLTVRVRRGIASPESLSFSAQLVWKVSHVVLWGRSLTATAPSSNFDPSGPTTRGALTGLYAGLASRGRTTDSDGDTVPDSRDHEPGTELGVQVDMFGRSRDDDGDGVWNGLDREPDTPRGTHVSQYGETDLDGDGVPESIDQCPDTGAEYVADERGCPDEVETTIIERVILEEGVLRERLPFGPGSAKLSPASEVRLNAIGRALSGLLDLRFKVDGHCDDRGGDELNDWLSRERAQIVVDYLVGRFPELTTERFSTNGYGKRIPIAEGSDERSRALNRRVEFVVENPDEAKRILRERKPRVRGGTVDSSSAIGTGGRNN